jgi:uncharacterized protein involved in response to NO
LGQKTEGSPSEAAAKAPNSARRAAAGTAIPRQGFRPFFLAAGVWVAIPNWTGRLPVGGRRLGVLFVLWCAGPIRSKDLFDTLGHEMP